MSYLVISLYFGILSLVENYIKIRSKILILFILSIFFGFSYINGADWVFYQQVYSRLPLFKSGFDIKLIENNYNFENAYIWLCLIAKNLGINFEFFRFLVMLFCINSLLKLVYKKTNERLILLNLVFVKIMLVYYMEPILRQLIAISLFYYSFDYLYEKNYKKYLLIIFCIMLFHKSGILLLLLLLLLRNQKIVGWKLVFIILIGSLFLPPLLIETIKVIFYNITILNKYFVYTGREYININYSNTFYIVQFFKNIIFFSTFFILEKYQKLKDERILISKLALISLVLGNMAITIGILNRFKLYFVIFHYILLTYLLSIILKPYKKIFIKFFINCYIIFTLLKSLILLDDKYPERYLPYTNYISLFIKNKLLTEEEKINLGLKRAKIYEMIDKREKNIN